MRRSVVALALLAVSALACNLAASPDPATRPAANATPLPQDGPPPQVVIEAPAAGAQAVVNRALSVRAHATDGAGITRVEMRESGRVVVTQPSPDPAPDFVAVLSYVPQFAGVVTLEVVAYRQGIASAPATVRIEVVNTVSELKNPNSLDPTLGVAAGAICSLRVKINSLNLRAGPGTSFASIARLAVGEQVSVIGRNADSSWYQVKRALGTAGWVSASLDYITPDGDCSKAPVVNP
jgi:hypothetical protein